MPMGGTGLVDPGALAQLEDPLLGQPDRGRVALGDENVALLYSEEFEYAATDFELPAKGGLRVRWRRTYRSRLLHSGPLGERWTHSYNEHLKVDADSVEHFDESGRIEELSSEDDVYEGGSKLLVEEVDGTYTLRMPGGLEKTFSVPDANGKSRLERIEDRRGQSIDLIYQSNGRLSGIIDPMGRTTAIQYFTSGRIRRVITPGGRVWNYGYSGDQLALARPPVVNCENLEVSYTYESTSSRMESCTYPIGLRFTNTYDGSGRLVSHARGEGAWSFYYAVGTNHTKSVQVYDRNGNRTTYVMRTPGPFSDAEKGHLVRIDRAMNRGIHPDVPIGTTYSTEFRNYPGHSVEEYADGREVDRWYDLENDDVLMRGNLIAECERPNDGGVDLLTWKDYEPRFQRIKREVPPQAFPLGSAPLILVDGKYVLDLTDPLVQKFQTVHFFDYEEVEDGIDYNGDGILGPEQGNVVKTVYPTSSTLPMAAERRILYNAEGRRLEVIDENGYRTRTFYWPMHDPFGMGSSSVPLSDYSSPTGMIARTVRGYSEDPATVNPLTAAPYVNVTEELRYDSYGNLLLQTDGNGNTEGFLFDKRGRLVAQLSPPPFLFQTHYQYDGNGNRILRATQNLHADGSVNTANPWNEDVWVYNELDQLVESKVEVAEGVYIATQYFYDKNGNFVLGLHPDAVSGVNGSNVSSRVMDELDLVYSATDGGTTVQFEATAVHSHINLSALGVTSLPEVDTTLYSYDSMGRLEKTEQADGQVMWWATDGYGRTDSRFFEDQSYDLYDHDRNGAVISERSYIDGHVLVANVAHEYDERGNKVVTRTEHFVLEDSAGSSSSTPVQDGERVERFYYNPGNQLVFAVDDRSLPTSYLFDGAGRTIKIGDSAGNVKVREYDGNGNRVRSTSYEVEDGASKQVSTTYGYDELNRQVSTSDDLGNTSTTERDSAGRPTRIVDQSQNAREWTYDGLGRILTESIELRDGGVGTGALLDVITRSWKYNANGKVVEYVDGEGHVARAGYNAMGRLLWNEFGDAASGTADRTSFVLGANGEATGWTDPNGTTVQLAHDANGHLSSRDATVSTAWNVDDLVLEERYLRDRSGRVVVAYNEVCSVERVYDSLGRLVIESLNLDGVSYETRAEYDAEGNLSKVVYPSGLDVQYVPDGARNEMGEIRIAGATYLEHEFAGADRVIRRSLASPVGVQWEVDLDYDAANRPSAYGLSFTQGGAGVLPSQSFSWSPSNQKDVIVSADATGSVATDYGYDSAGRLTVVDGVERFVYDHAGNRTVADGVSYVSNDRNQMVGIGPTALTYDANGNRVSQGSRTFVYDYENRLRKVVESGTVLAEYFYDPLGRRVKSVSGGRVRHEVWFGTRLIERVDDLSRTSERVVNPVYGMQLDEVPFMRVDGQDYFLVRDHQGSTTHVLDGAGQVVERYAYDEYGAPSLFDGSGQPRLESAIGNPFLFTGRSWEAEVDLYYLRARYYSPFDGTFLTRDPVGVQGGPNVYAYTENDPVNSTDPLGTTSWKNLLERSGWELHKLDINMSRLALTKEVVDFGFGVPKKITSLRKAAKGFGDLKSTGDGVVESAQGVVDATAAFTTDLGRVVKNFMNQIVSKAEMLTRLEDTIGNEIMDSRDFKLGRQEVTGTRWNEHVQFRIDDGEGGYINVWDDGFIEGEVSAGKGKWDVFTYDFATGIYHMDLHDGSSLTRWDDPPREGWTEVCDPEGRCFLYNKKGALISRCKKGEDCDEDEESESSDMNPPPENK